MEWKYWVIEALYKKMNPDISYCNFRILYNKSKDIQALEENLRIMMENRENTKKKRDLIDNLWNYFGFEVWREAIAVFVNKWYSIERIWDRIIGKRIKEANTIMFQEYGRKYGAWYTRHHYLKYVSEGLTDEQIDAKYHRGNFKTTESFTAEDIKYIESVRNTCKIV